MVFSKRAIEEYFLEKDEEIRKLNIIERELKVLPSKNYIISIFGPRRSGKTYYLYSFYDKNSVYLNFEDVRLEGVNGREILDLIKIYTEIFGRAPRRILLDEVQNVKGWDQAVRTIFDLHKYEILITGSSSKFLSKEISTKLRGRTERYILLPFSFREFLKVRNFDYKKRIFGSRLSKLKFLLREYLKFGGFPDVVLGNRDPIKFFEEYLDLILFRDFVERHGIKRIRLARFLVRFLISGSPKEISGRSLYEKILGSGIRTSKDTIYDYLDKIEDTAFFFFLERYSKKIHLRESWPKKIYIGDPGILNLFHEDFLDKSMEIIVFLELLRRKYAEGGLEISYYKDQYGEIDFVIERRGKVKELIQVTYELGESNYNREVNALFRIGKKFACRNLTLITFDQEDTIERNGRIVKVIPLWEYLISKKVGHFLLKLS